MIAIVGLALGACSKEPPASTVAQDATVLPCECFPACRPPPAEPKIAADIPEGASDLVATRDRQAWKRALRAERGARRACAERLKVLFPKEVKS